MLISELRNDLSDKKPKPTREIMHTDIDGINENIPHKNGFVYIIIGAPGTGKSSLLLSLFRDKNYYKGKFENVYLITPESSFLSVRSHPFKNHSNVFHELDAQTLNEIYLECLESKQECIELECELEHSILIIDDFAADLKDINIIKALKKILTKSRHICLSVIFTLQAYNMFPLVLRKMITDITLFKPKNRLEMENIRKELVNLNENDMITLSDYVFDEEYNHLSINTASGVLRKNFNVLTITK